GKGNISFAPLYPLLIRVTQPVFFGNGLVAALFISNLAFLIAMVLLHKLVAPVLGETVAVRSVWLTALFPLSYYLQAAYTESIFLALALAALLFASRGRWWAAAVPALLAPLARVQ